MLGRPARAATLPSMARIVVTMSDTSDHADPERAARRAGLYLDAVRRHGGDPVPVDTRTAPEAVARALESMDGLLLTGGGDIDPARYGKANEGSRDVDVARDALEARAWAAAAERGARHTAGNCFAAAAAAGEGALGEHKRLQKRRAPARLFLCPFSLPVD